MKTGIRLITEKRRRQTDVHDRTVEKDVRLNSNFQLTTIAKILMENPLDRRVLIVPREAVENWDINYIRSLFDLPYKERLILAGSFIAAEIDRIQFIESGAPVLK